MFSLIVIVNSENSDIWPITFDLIKKNFKNTEIVVYVDDINIFNNNVIINYNFKIKQYNNSDTFTQRLYNIANEYTNKYFLLVRDNDWICNANENKLLDLIPIMEHNNIDRLALYSDGHYDHTSDKNSFNKIEISSEDYFIKCKEYFNFSYMPSLWNKDGLIKITTNFLNLTYREFEASVQVQSYSQQNLNVYSLYSNISVKKTWGCYLVPYFEFIHIFYRGKWILSSYDTMIDDFNKIVKEYNIDINKRLGKNILEHN